MKAALKLVSACAGAILVAACASTPAERSKVAAAPAPTPAATPDSGSKIICADEEVTGTHFSRRRCRTEEQIREEREAAEDALRRTSAVVNPRQGGN